ncbi:MAG: hypothetical protein KBT47_08770 [Armatimonadetes bacterium]|nr:hypothetical protein [Candidatus Hippobium faecium]
MDINTEPEEITIELDNYVYSALSGKPKINSAELIGNKTGADLGLQDKLTAGQNITIEQVGDNLVISALGGGGGGKTFRLLNTVTGARLTAISRNLDDNGQPFHYKDLIIEYTNPDTKRNPVFYLNDNYGTADGFAGIYQGGRETFYFFTNSVNNLFYAPIAVVSNSETAKIMTPKFAPPHPDNSLAVTQHTGWSCTYTQSSQNVTIRVWGDDQ